MAALDLAVKANQDAHLVTDKEMEDLRELMRQQARRQIAASPLAVQFGSASPDKAYVEAYVDAMMVELTWCISHFSGLLNRWFTLLKVKDEDFAVGPNNMDFAAVYNATVPESIKARNNALLGPTGWGY
ncbi:MAG: hypothetical protein JOZ62_19390 [Acidobacteriaceae bacterium]|nr:hypothetical protein [Acidobacteriaceae bacterium]